MLRLNICERVCSTRSPLLTGSMLSGQIARGQALLLAAAPVIPALSALELAHSLDAQTDKVVIRYELVAKKQLPMFAPAQGHSKKGSKQLILEDLKLVRESILRRQEEFDELASDGRRLGKDIFARLSDVEKDLLSFLERHSGEVVNVDLPDGEMQLHIPSLSALQEVNEPAIMRAHVVVCARFYAELAEPSIQDVTEQWTPILNLNDRSFKLRWDNNSSCAQQLKLSEAMHTRQRVEFTAKLVRSGIIGQPVGAIFVNDTVEILQ